MKKPIFSKHKTLGYVYLPAQYIENKLQFINVYRDRITLRPAWNKDTTSRARVILNYWETPHYNPYRMHFLESLSRLLL